ncbi:hypothetical protein [Marinobacter sp.]|uniref:hypothetical protein n=1 Tax=Marinobacter sp. TaxID=50741 RepID=UPI003A924E92
MERDDRGCRRSIFEGIILLLLTAALFSDGKAREKQSLDNGIGENFPAVQIKDISDFKQYAHPILLIVAKKMGVELGNEIPAPLILIDVELTEREFNLWLGNTGEPFHAMFPYYFPENNTIVVVGTSRLDSLAHEFVHYLQVQYEHINIDFSDAHQLELEAVEIQHWFKQNYMY